MKKNGKGVIYYKNNDNYDVEWVNEVIEGKGIRIYTNKKESYNGEWKREKKNGKKHIYSNDDKYKGKYKGNCSENIREGNGVYTFSNETIYADQFKNNKINGKGKYIYKNGKYMKDNL